MCLKEVRVYISDDMKINIALVCGGCLFIILFIFVFLKGHTQGNRLMRKAKETGSVVTGNAVKHSYRSHGYLGKFVTEIVTYEYVVDNRKYKRKIEFSSTGIVVNYPLEVTIYYDKHNPNKARADVEVQPESQHQTGCYIAIVVPIIAVIVVYNLLKFFV